jgi:hypothetical protein
MKGYESVLRDSNSSSIRVYLGTVVKVSKSKSPAVKDHIDNDLNPMEIIFSVGSLIQFSRARPLEQTNEVVEGDSVIIFSMEHIYNNTYYYHSIRFLSPNNGSIYMKYDNSQIILVPREEGKAELIAAGGKSIISIDSIGRRINIESDIGGININSHEGFISIQNDKTSLYKILKETISMVSNLKVLTPLGPAPVGVGTKSKALLLDSEVDRLFSDIESSSSYPNLPDNTYTKEFAQESGIRLGPLFFNDEGVEDPGGDIIKLQTYFDQTEVDTLDSPETLPDEEISLISEEIFPEDEVKWEENTDPQLSFNFKLSDVSTRAVFPHKLTAQNGLTEDEILKNLQALALNVLEPIKKEYPNMQINSGFRTRQNGKSQHEFGQAVDIQFPGMLPKEYLEVSKWVLNNVLFDQIIFEHGNSIWLHISFRKGNNRKNLLTMLNNKYTKGITLHYT